MLITDNKKISKAIRITYYDKNKSSLDDVEMAIASRAFAKLLLAESRKKLKVIQLTSAGFEGVDTQLAKERGITICNAADVYNVGMAEFVVYGMLIRAKRYNQSIKNRWLRPFRNYHYITELAGKTVGILGAGNIGQQIAKRLEAFDMHVLGYDLRTDDRPHFEKVYNSDSLGVFLGQCDYIVNCMPLFPSTEGLLNRSWFDLMKKNVTIINVGRKKIINDEDFITFLKHNKETTAILDMFEKIPNPITNPYRRLSNVLVLPGVTAISQEIDFKLENLCRTNIRLFEEGKPLLNIINR